MHEIYANFIIWVPPLLFGIPPPLSYTAIFIIPKTLLYTALHGVNESVHPPPFLYGYISCIAIYYIAVVTVQAFHGILYVYSFVRVNAVFISSIV